MSIISYSMQLNLIVARAYFYIYCSACEGLNSFTVCLIYYYKVFGIKRFNRFVGACTVFNLGFIKVTNLELEV